MADFQQIDVHAVVELIHNGRANIVDIRNQDAYDVEHIQGAVHLDDQNVHKFIEQADKTKPLVCYCYHGFSSQSAAGFFKSQGFEEVYSMIGGFEEWKRNFPDVS